MISELKKRIESGKVFLGMRESLRNMNNLDKAIVAADCRKESIKILESKNIKIESFDMRKDEMASKLELEFECEVFGVRK